MKKIFIVGSLNMDLTIKTPYIPKAGETITGSDFITNCGGKGANQATAAGKLGGVVHMYGAVGNGAVGRALINNLSNANVDTKFVKSIDNISTGIAVIIISDGNNRIILDKGANGELTTSDISSFLDNSSEGDIYLTQLENPIDVVGEGLKIAKSKGLYTILNPAPANINISKYFSMKKKIDFVLSLII